ncbi:MAG: DUF58 domain-containing protein [Oscillospiraceae bacterium]|nr:DUF58 domain-containing protein [Oscillospiraceae bacterium]MBR4193684.1 DUF58 domain-containing protein [Oscillospiraceae bacterium]
MAVNRLLYGALLVLSVVYYFASATWFSWLLLVLILALPILSLLLSLPAMLSCRLDAVMAETVEQNAPAALHLRLHSWRVLPLPDVQIRLNLRTRDHNKDLRYLSRLTRTDGVLALPTDSCGFLSAEFRRGRVYDALGLFRLPMKLPAPEPMAILPPERTPTPMPRLEQFLQQQMKPKPGGGSAEQHEHRSYRPGDPVKDIHWKLSLKTDQLIVREALEPVRRRVILALRTPRGSESRAETLGNFRWLFRWLLENGIPHSAVWMDGAQLREQSICCQEDGMEALRAACLAPEESLDLPWPLPLQADWICPVGRNGGNTP